MVVIQLLWDDDGKFDNLTAAKFRISKELDTVSFRIANAGLENAFDIDPNFFQGFQVPFLFTLSLLSFYLSFVF